MQRFARNMILFVPFTLMVYCFMLLAWGTLSPRWLRSNLVDRQGEYGHMYTRLKEVKKTENVDILFLGSSHAYRGFDPRIFAGEGYKTFNLGSSAQTPIQTKLLLDRYLDKLDPEWVIYEVFPETFAIDGVESALDIISNDQNDRLSVQMALELNNPKSYHTLAYAFMRDALGINAKYNEPVQKDSDTYVIGGYVEKVLTTFHPGSMASHQVKIRDRNLEAFSKTMAMLKSRGVHVLLVYAPVTSGLYHSFSNNRMFDSTMKQYAPYYNFNQMLKLDDSVYFYDSHHLNQSGVEVFNKAILDVLKNEKEVK